MLYGSSFSPVEMHHAQSSLRELPCAALAGALVRPAADLSDPSAPIEKRVDDLLGRLTLEEKVSQLMNDSAAIDRLGVPRYNWWGECLQASPAPAAPPFSRNRSAWPPPGTRAAPARLHRDFRRSPRQVQRFRPAASATSIKASALEPNVNLFRDPRWDAA